MSSENIKSFASRDVILLSEYGSESAFGGIFAKPRPNLIRLVIGNYLRVQDSIDYL